MPDRDIKVLLICAGAILIFAIALFYSNNRELTAARRYFSILKALFCSLLELAGTKVSRFNNCAGPWRDS
jgi:hypothetical protein